MNYLTRVAPLATLLALSSTPALAYVGPGLGLGVIGTIFGVLAAIVLAIFGLFWYPIKRALGKGKKTSAASGRDEVDKAKTAITRDSVSVDEAIDGRPAGANAPRTDTAPNADSPPNVNEPANVNPPNNPSATPAGAPSTNRGS